MFSLLLEMVILIIKLAY